MRATTDQELRRKAASFFLTVLPIALLWFVLGLLSAFWALEVVPWYLEREMTTTEWLASAVVFFFAFPFGFHGDDLELAFFLNGLLWGVGVYFIRRWWRRWAALHKRPLPPAR